MRARAASDEPQRESASIVLQTPLDADDAAASHAERTFVAAAADSGSLRLNVAEATLMTDMCLEV